MEEIIKEFIEVAHEVFRKGLVTGSVGNISTRLNGERILISSSHSFLGHLTQNDLVIVNLDGEKIEGSKEPSLEKLIHLEIYKGREDVKAIIHTHSPYASVYGFLGKELMQVNPESEYLLGKVPLVPPFISGSRELAESVRAHLGNFRAVLLEKHGVIAVGGSLYEALNIAELVEEVAKINYLVDTLKKAN